MGAASRLLAVRLPTLAAVGLLFCASAGGDVFHLRGGGQIEGEMINRDGGLVRIQTPHAQVTLSADDVVRVEQHPHARQIKLYEELAGKIPKTADGHYQLGLWCLEHGLADQAREEFNKALRCDAQHADARYDFEEFFDAPRLHDREAVLDHLFREAGLSGTGRFFQFQRPQCVF